LLANIITVVGDVACTLAEFGAAWVMTGSDYDGLFATTMRNNWARRHRPVLSRGQDIHIKYTGYNVTEPYRQVVQCHQGCGIENRMYNASNCTVTVSCRRCGSSCLIDRVAPDTTVLGSRSIVATSYPPELVTTVWGLKGSTTKANPPAKLTPRTGPASMRDAPTPAECQARGRAPLPKDGVHSTSISQVSTSRPIFLAPPTVTLSHSTLLPVPPSTSGDGLPEAISPMEQQADPPANLPTILSQPVGPPETSLKIRLPARNTMAHSHSLPKMDEPQVRLKRRPLELSTSVAPKSKKQRGRR